MRLGASVVWNLLLPLNNINKTEAALFSIQAMLSRDFSVFLDLNSHGE